MTSTLKELEALEHDAWLRSTRKNVVELTQFLVEHLGVAIVAVGTKSADGRPIRTWQKGQANPRPEAEERLRLLYRVTFVITEVYGAQTARAFLRGASPYLGNRAPLEVIADDSLSEAAPAVLAALRGFLEA